MFSTFSSAPAAAPPTPAPAADAPSKTEQTPLVAGKSETSEEKPWMTALAMVVMIGIAVGKTQLTAFLFSYADFPTAYSGWSCVVTCILIGCVFPFKPSMWACPTRQMWPMLLIIVLFTSLDLAGTNIALANLSTSFQQCIAATNPFITIIIETLLYCKLQHWLTYSVVAVVVVGTVLTSLGQVEIDLVGLIFELLAVCSSAAKYAFTHKAFRDFKGQLGALALLFWIDLLMIPVFTVWTLSTGELQLFFADVLHSSTDWWQMTGARARPTFSWKSVYAPTRVPTHACVWRAHEKRARTHDARKRAAD